MTGVQTCALPICFPVTIQGGIGHEKTPTQAGTDVKKAQLQALRQAAWDAETPFTEYFEREVIGNSEDKAKWIERFNKKGAL